MSHGHHGDNPHQGHHWDSMQQQFAAGKLGMWLFLVQEILFFSGLFCAYILFRINDPAIFEFGSQFLDPTLGFTNTLVLLVSSLTMALAVRCAQTNNIKMLQVNLVLTFVCACAFMGIKYVEYAHKFDMGIKLGRNFEYAPLYEAVHSQNKFTGLPEVDAKLASKVVEAKAVAKNKDATDLPLAGSAPTGFGASESSSRHVESVDHGDHGEHASHFPDIIHVENGVPNNLHVFFGIYYCMTGLHGIHVVAGMIMILWLLRNARRGKYSSKYFTEVDLGALYWHIVDLVWIFLFPLLYLM